ncbi:MAG: sigma-70 family RNA polymerase sigma factor [Saprospiraceae bacterium]
MLESTNVQVSVEHLFRHESGKMLAVLVKLFGLPQVGVAEDIVQETLLAALETWKLRGMPDQPRAWLYRTAKNKTIDFLRRERNFQANIAPNLHEAAARSTQPDRWLDSFFLDDEIEDAQLRMMFACCHPAIPAEAQLVLMLRSLCGLSIREIAAAFLQPEETMAKRLYRAKEKIRQENLSLDVPTGADLAPRLDAVLQAIYLLFNEGYKSASEAAVIRRELCGEALRLGGLLLRHPAGQQSKTYALQALMCFQASRFDARLDDSGAIVLLENQDRSRWNQQLISAGYANLQGSFQGNAITEYHLEAAIASYHASAPSFGQTNWKSIFYCYDLLLKINPSPFVALNRAIALGYADGPQVGISALEGISELEQHYLYHAALGDFFVKLENTAAARQAFKTALQLAQLPAERRVLELKLAALKTS